jgi:drug/metabolite transporter (DMT)-like permease
VLGFLMFGNLPDGWAWAGSAVIVVAGSGIAWREARRRSLVPAR